MPLEASRQRVDRSPPSVAAIVGVLAVAVPLVVLLVQQLTQLGVPGVPCCDYAVLELGTREFLRGDRLVGLYSREGWYHPGPAPFAWTSLFRPLPGRAFAEHQVAAVVLVIVAIGTLVVALYRRLDIVALTAGLAIVAIWMARFDIAPASEPWNPITAMSWVVIATVAAAMFATGGSTWWLMAYAVSASAAVQSHLGTAGAVAVSLAAVGLGAWRGRDAVRAGPGLRYVGIVVGVVWLLPIVDLVAGDRNLARIVHNSLTGDRDEAMSRLDIGRGALQTLAMSPSSQSLDFGPASPFVDAVPIGPGSFVFAAVALGLGAYAVATRSRHPFAAALVGLAAGGIVASALVLSFADGPFYRYLVYPTLGLGLLVWVGGSVAVVADVVRRAPTTRVPLAVGCSLVATVAGVVAIPGPRPAVADAYSTAITDELVMEVEQRCAELPRRVVVVAPDDDDWPTTVAVAAVIERCTVVESLGLTGFVMGPSYEAGEGATPNVFVGVPSPSTPAGTDIATAGDHVVRLIGAGG